MRLSVADEDGNVKVVLLAGQQEGLESMLRAQEEVLHNDQSEKDNSNANVKYHSNNNSEIDVNELMLLTPRPELSFTSVSSHSTASSSINEDEYVSVKSGNAEMKGDFMFRSSLRLEVDSLEDEIIGFIPNQVKLLQCND